MKKFSIFIIAPIVLLFFLVIGGYVWYQNATGAPSTNTESQRVVITKGASTEKIANTLKEAGVIKSAFAFRLYTQLNNQSRSIPAGEFEIPQNLNIEQLITELRKGPQQIWVTIPEGLRLEEIPDKFIEALGLSGDQAEDFRSEFVAEADGLEGYLFPDTYLFPPEVSAITAVQTLRNTFDVKFPDSERAKLDKLGLSLDEAVTLASLIERETLTKEERPVVAGILYNRLNEGMPLQIDATVQYAVANECRLSSTIRNCEWWPKGLTREQIQNTESPYNTYLNTGIPPAPISNPGLTSLMAVANPEESDYFYYIHAEGQIYYARTLEEHNANVARYLN